MLVFWRVLIINRCWILSKSFSASIEMIIWFLIFQFVNMVCHIDWLAYLEESLHSWNKLNLIMVYELFDVLLNSVYYFVVDFCIYVHKCYWPVVFLCVCCLCLVLVSGWWWPHRMSLEVFLPLQFFETVRQIGISSSLNVW